MRRSALGAGAKSLERGSTFARRGGARRPPAERARAEAWHEAVCAEQACVVCGADAGPYGHHALPKSWLRDIGLAGHRWDLALGVPVCVRCHARHESAVSRVTRAELIRAGLWGGLVAWCRRLDARYFPGREPLLCRLESDYPMEVPVQTIDVLDEFVCQLELPDGRLLRLTGAQRRWLERHSAYGVPDPVLAVFGSLAPASAEAPGTTALRIAEATGLAIDIVTETLWALSEQHVAQVRVSEVGLARWSLVCA